ncbi:MAG: ABC transporter ATP-binding protein [Desulfurococcales archaeon]|nr:ABC transporter ATP-binding protein [Desulfurococcales archaeon]
MAEPPIFVDHLFKRYGRVIAVKQLTFKAGEGEILGILGPNGAGKTTTLRAIAGALKPTMGKVLVYGLNSYREAPKVKKIIGVMPEVPSLFPELTVKENLEFLGKIYGLARSETEEAARRTAELMELTEYLEVRYGHLSKGLKRRADMSGALIHDPRIVVLDEPTAGLDVFSSSHLRNIIRELRSTGKTLIISSHYIDEVMELSQRVVILYKGAKIYEGAPRRLREILELGKRVKITFDQSLDYSLWEALKNKIAKSIEGEPLFTGDFLEVYTKDPLLLLDTLKGYLATRGYSIVDIDILPPSWEDVFKRYMTEAKQPVPFTVDSERKPCSCGAE